MKIVIGADHGGFELKNSIIQALSKKATFIDAGPVALDAGDDYPDYGDAVAEAVAEGQADFGVLVCRSGVGMSMVANRFLNVRAAICPDAATAKTTREHNNANVACLAADKLDAKAAAEIVKAFISAKASKEVRHVRRVAKLERARRIAEFSGLAKDDPEIHAAIMAQVKQED